MTAHGGDDALGTQWPGRQQRQEPYRTVTHHCHGLTGAHQAAPPAGFKPVGRAFFGLGG
jgi:hypothetical protein